MQEKSHHVFALGFLALASAGCIPAPQEHRFVTWRMEDDLTTFEGEASENPERSGRLEELADGLQSREYGRFLEVLARTPPSQRAFIYYEISGANGVWFFALATESGGRCELVAIDYDSLQRRTCRGFQTFEPSVHDDVRPIRDVIVSALVQYEPGRPPIRALTIGGVAPPTSDGQAFIDRVRRHFTS